MTLLSGKSHLPGEEPFFDVLLEDRGELRRSTGQKSTTGHRRRHQQFLELAKGVPGQAPGQLQYLDAF